MLGRVGPGFEVQTPQTRATSGTSEGRQHSQFFSDISVSRECLRLVNAAAISTGHYYREFCWAAANAVLYIDVSVYVTQDRRNGVT